MAFLGLDISTSCVGVSIISKSGELIFVDHIDLEHLERDLIVKTERVQHALSMLRVQYEIEEVWIEECIEHASAGTNAHTLAVLIAFNRMVAWVTYTLFNKRPKEVPASTARKLVIGQGRKTKKTQHEDIKITALNWVVSRYPEFAVSHTRAGNVTKQTLDRSDSVVLSYYGYLQSLSHKIA